jgi:hypothetical protein
MTTDLSDLAASMHMADAILALARIQAARDGHPIPQSLADLPNVEERAMLTDAVTLALGWLDRDTRVKAVQAADAEANDGWDVVAERKWMSLHDVAVLRGSLGRACARAYIHALLGRG